MNITITPLPSQPKSSLMVTRRNIRIKVMQTLYALLPLDANLTNSDEALKQLHKHFNNSRLLLLYTIQTIIRIAQYAEIDARRSAAKNLPTKEDLQVNTSIAQSAYLQSIITDSLFAEAVEKYKINLLLQDDIIKKLYVQLKKSDVYKMYVANGLDDKKSGLQICTYILNEVMLNNEVFTAQLEEIFTNVDDDIDILYAAATKYLQKPGSVMFEDVVGKEKMKFATSLLQTVLDKAAYLSTLINPKLKNWDADRIAALDMIILKLGTCEMLYFETIPVKVTINEYIDIAKEYSTAQSGQFINGLLDNIHKELVAQNKLHKVDFRQV
ncbi:MAG TPA: transcription antitermination factor NusB [Chitinophagaceae bacterium]|nr:transcription antitermination factor NusB [Chitinophagaceae bacterium]